MICIKMFHMLVIIFLLKSFLQIPWLLSITHIHIKTFKDQKKMKGCEIFKPSLI